VKILRFSVLRFFAAVSSKASDLRIKHILTDFPLMHPQNGATFAANFKLQLNIETLSIPL